jgi:hypothetical protein
MDAGTRGLLIRIFVTLIDDLSPPAAIIRCIFVTLIDDLSNDDFR